MADGEIAGALQCDLLVKLGHDVVGGESRGDFFYVGANGEADRDLCSG